MRGVAKPLGTALVAGAALLAPPPAGAVVVHRLDARSYSVVLRAPARANLSVSRLTFPLGTRLPGSSAPDVQVLLRASRGAYVAAGVLFPRRPTTLSVLVAVVNRRPAMALYPDRATYSLRVTGARLTHVPRTDQVVNALSPPAPGRVSGPAILCGDHAGTLSPLDVRMLLTGGTPFGFSAATVLTQGYDAACLRPVSPAFTSAIAGA